MITVDELLIHRYDPKLKCESETWLQEEEGKHQKVQQQKSAVAMGSIETMTYR